MNPVYVHGAFCPVVFDVLVASSSPGEGRGRDNNIIVDGDLNLTLNRVRIGDTFQWKIDFLVNSFINLKWLGGLMLIQFKFG